MDSIQHYISIESETLFGEVAPRYFIDLVTALPGEKPSHGNLRSTRDIHEARKIARQRADELGVSVRDETMTANRDVRLANV